MKKNGARGICCRSASGQPEEVAQEKDRLQEKAAEKMKVSQPTFSRILKNARKKISEAIIKGKAIKINKKNQLQPNL